MKLTLAGVVLCLSLFAISAEAGHWTGYKWNKAPPVQLTVYDGTTNWRWQRAIQEAVMQWNLSPEIEFTIVRTTSCNTRSGAIVICEGPLTYPTDGQTTLRTHGKDNYLSSVTIIVTNDSTWNLNADGSEDTDYSHYRPRQHVTCHELGHALGLGERIYPDLSCLDSGLPDIWLPDTHDYDELALVY